MNESGGLFNFNCDIDLNSEKLDPFRNKNNISSFVNKPKDPSFFHSLINLVNK